LNRRLSPKLFPYKLNRIFQEKDFVKSVVFHPYQDYIAVWTADNHVFMQDIQNGNIKLKFEE